MECQTAIAKTLSDPYRAGIAARFMFHYCEAGGVGTFVTKPHDEMRRRLNRAVSKTDSALFSRLTKISKSSCRSVSCAVFQFI